MCHTNTIDIHSFFIFFIMYNIELTNRLINRIKEVENFENVAWVCKNFSDFCDEVLEWGVDHAAGVDFDDPDLDFDALDNAIASIGLPPSECL